MRIQTNFYTMTACDNLLYIEAFSSWDERVALDYIADLRKIGLALYREKPWAILSDRTRWYLYTPGAEKLITGAIPTITTRLSHIGVVVGQSEIKKWQTRKMVDCKTGFEIRFFDAMPDARSWLTSLGYSLTPVDGKELPCPAGTPVLG
jgi:hypothetical protein